MAHSYISVSTHPFLEFDGHPEFASRASALLGRTILHGRRIDIPSTNILGFSAEIERMLNVLPYRRVFTATEPCFEELITEFYASFEFHGSFVSFQLGGVLRNLPMPEFGRALGLWTAEEQTTEVYTTAVTDFTEDVSVYWSHISRNNAPFVQYRTKATGIQPVLRYLHAVLAYTVTGRSDSQGNVNATDAGILSHLYRGISVDLTFTFARIARDYVASVRKKSLGLGPFITRVARYFQVDTLHLTRCSESTVPLDHIILRNMRMIKRVGQRYVVVDPPTDAPEDPVPAEDPELVAAPTPISQSRRVRRRPSREDLPEESSSSTFVGRNEFERFVVSQLTHQSSRIDGIHARLDTMAHRVERTEHDVQLILQHFHLSRGSSDHFSTPPHDPPSEE